MMRGRRGVAALVAVLLLAVCASSCAGRAGSAAKRDTRSLLHKRALSHLTTRAHKSHSAQSAHSAHSSQRGLTSLTAVLASVSSTEESVSVSVSNEGNTLCANQTCTHTHAQTQTSSLSSVSAPSAPSSAPVRASLSRLSAFLSLFLPWLYFLAGALNIPTLPRYVNAALSAQGDGRVSQRGAEVFGLIQGLDAFFTFLTVNLIGVLSDVYGRRRFMVFSSLGLGVSHLLMSLTHTPTGFYLASCVDGVSSCMLSQSQAYVSDLQASLGDNESESESESENDDMNGKTINDNDNDSDNRNNTIAGNETLTQTHTQTHVPANTGTRTRTDTPAKQSLGVALSRFQGVAVGLAYLVGIPMGAVLSRKLSPRAPLQVSFALCALNAVLIALFLPSPPARAPTMPSSSSTSENSDASKKKIDWTQANPLGAINLFLRNRRLLLGGIIYFLINLAQASLQVNWINYLQHRFQWSAELSGCTLMLVGLFVAVLPSYFVPLVGKLNAIKYALLMHSLIVAFLGWNSSPIAVFAILPLLAIGASSLPMLLGYLTELVPSDEVGALQGAADTLRTISAMLGAPVAAKLFAYCIDERRAFPGGAFFFTSIFSMTAFLLIPYM